VSTYLATFTLIAVALAGSVGVYGAMQTLASSSQGGASVTVSYASIRQGSGVAVETLTLTNTGTVTITSLTVSVLGVSSAATFYLSLTNPSSGAALASSCGEPHFSHA